MSGSSLGLSDFLLVVGLLLLITGVVVGVIWFATRRKVRCAACQKPVIRGRTVCPYCKTPYANAPVSHSNPSSQSAFQLIGIEGTYANRVLSLNKERLSIGRAPENDLSLQADMLSRHHAELRKQNGQYVLIDHDSTNGTYVNDRRIQSAPLRSGDRIQLGTLVFVYQDASGAAPPPVPAQSDTSDTSAPVISSTVGGSKGYTLGDFQLAGTIGGGGAARVYRGISLKDRTPVAVKILNTNDPLLRDKFRAEGGIGTAFRHPHIARVYAYGESNGTYYIVMEYVDGGSLRQQMAHGRPSPIEFIIPVIGQTCEALAYAHAFNPRVIHRDIKPENIMLSSKDGIKVVDFGIAKLANASHRTSTGVRMGTPYYMSYEQAQGIDVVPASDIYSLGVVLFEMLTGSWPFSGPPIDVLHKHVSQPPPSPRALNPNVSPHMEAVVMRALEKRTSHRYQNAMELARDIGYRSGMSFTVPPLEHLTTSAALPPVNHVSPPAPEPPPLPVAVAHLAVYEGKTRRRIISLRPNMNELGRNEINIADDMISRHHLRLYVANGQFGIEDLDSRNGTYLNNQPLPKGTRVTLRIGDLIRVGNTTLRLEK